jgi:hypothetical protein
MHSNWRRRAEFIGTDIWRKALGARIAVNIIVA